MPNDILLSISDAAEMMDVSISTLRRWDESGRFRPEKSEGGHRRYSKNQIELYLNDLFALAKDWAINGTELPSIFYCRISPAFKGRLDVMAILISRNPSLSKIYNLLVNVAGEIGINSFDHNLGNWPDNATQGIFFGYDMNKRMIVLADRGRGVLATLKLAIPTLKNHEDALRAAFTEYISGRQPENRGQGLKYVRKIVSEDPIGLIYFTGDAELEIIKDSNRLNIGPSGFTITGTLAKITF